MKDWFAVYGEKSTIEKVIKNKDVENMALNGEALLKDYKDYFTSTDVNRLKEVPSDIEKREELLENSVENLWNALKKIIQI